MKSFFLILFIAIVSTFTVLSQPKNRSSELGLFLGANYYIGDLNPLGHFNQFTKPAGGVVFRYNFNERLAARGNLYYGSIEGDDSFSNSASQQQRNLSFNSKIIELSSQLEFNFLNYLIGDDNKLFSPYIFAGLAGFKFNPKANINGSWVELQPLGTEGQGLNNGATKRKYKRTQISIPFGVGIKTNLSARIGLSVEWGMRKTFTDYIDDVSKRYYDPAVLAVKRGATAANLSDPSIGTDPNFSNVGRQRGNAITKDWYVFSGIALTVKFKQKIKKCYGVY